MLVTVIMPVYNGEKYIGAAIESILNQTFKDFELLIINDASTDLTVSIIEKYQDKRVRLIHNEINMGLACVRNKGIENATGKYIAWLDSDDISMATRLEKQVAVLEENADIGLCGTWVRTFGAEEHLWRYPVESGVIKGRMLFDDPIATSSVMLKKEILDKLNYKFDLEYPPAEDYDLWERLSAHTNIINIPEVLTHYRLHDSQTSYSEEGMNRQEKSVWKVQERILLRLGIVPDDIEKKIHKKIGHKWDFSGSRSDIENEINWLNKLYKANCNKKIFEMNSFGFVLAERLYFICNAPTSFGLSTWKIFTNSAISRYLPGFRYRIFKMGIKCIVNGFKK